MLSDMQLADFLTEKNLSVIKFAERIAVSRQAVHRYLNGQQKPEWDVLERIARETDGRVMPNDFISPQVSEAAQ